ncbi:MAG: hypothetical protein K6A63_05135 [Acholeplasmatales bacterium]|nr:hypothetical protein [Acholeplasmatales bacterium]
MKKIVCDLCGESDFVKVEGMFECQVCGAKYTIEEAKTLFRDVDETAHSNNATVDEAPEFDEPAGRQVAQPKAGPTIVRKVVVAKPSTNSADSGAAKKIVSAIKKPAPAGTTKVVAAKSGQPTPVVKKVVVKPTTVAKPAAKAAPVQRTRQVDTSGAGGTVQMIENLFILSENAYDSENYVDAENYANRVIEIDADNSDAWLMKGNCAARLSTKDNFRFKEAINCWNTCLLRAEKDEFDDYQFTVRTNLIDIMVAFVLKSCIDFAKEPSNENFAKVKETIDLAEPMMRLANQTFGVEIATYEDKLASNISAVVTKVSKQAIQDFGKKKETQTVEAYKKFVTTQDICINSWDYLIDLAKRHGTVTAILSSVVKMQEAIIRNKGYEQKGNKIKVALECSMTERNTRLEAIKAEKKKLDDKFVDIRKRDRVEQKMKNDKYWEEHQEEKAQLLDEHSKLDHEIFELENSKLKMPELNELKKLEEEAIRLQVLKDNPVYSNKERAAYMDELNKTRKQIVTKKRELATRLNPIEDKIEKYKKRMFNIERELNMNR